MRTFLFFILLSATYLYPRCGLAQGYAEGVALSYELLPLKFKTGDAPGFQAHVLRASAIMPVAVSADTSRCVLAGAGFEMLRFVGERTGFDVTSVYGLSPILGYRYRPTKRVELTALALPALNSDLRELRAADLTWGGVLRAAWQRNPHLTYRLTLGYRQQFYGPQYVLLLGLDWGPTARWRVFGDLPTTFTVSYAATPRVNVGFNLIGINTAYRLTPNDSYLQYQQGHYGLFAETYLAAHWALRATAAYAVTRRVELYARDQQWPATLDYVGLGSAPVPQSAPLAKGPTFRLALSYRVATR